MPPTHEKCAWQRSKKLDVHCEFELQQFPVTPKEAWIPGKDQQHQWPYLHFEHGNTTNGPPETHPITPDEVKFVLCDVSAHD